MPRNVRNFWIEADIDGLKEMVATGPIAADGGISVRILQRNEGGIVTALRIYGIADSDGHLELTAHSDDGAQKIVVITKR